MIRTLFALVVKQFYQINTGFFLLCFLVFFGILNFVDAMYLHYSIMRRADEPLVFLLLAVICLLYAYKCFNYTYRALQLPQHGFLYQLQAYENRKQWRIFSYLHLTLYLPVLCYALITAGVLLAHHKFIAAILMLLYQVILVYTAVFLQLHRLNTTHATGRLDEMLERIAMLMPARKRFAYWLLYYLAYERKGAFLGIKIGSLVLLQLLVTYNTRQLNRESVAFIMLGLVAIHAVLPYYIRQFAEGRLQFVRAMPLSFFRRFGWFAFTYAMLLLPELLFLLLHIKGALSVGTLLSIYLLPWALLCFFSSLLYIPSMGIERYMLLVAGLFFASLLLLTSIPTHCLGVGYMGLSILLYYFFYERWQSNTG